MNELALFAGAGGGILGGKLLGWRTVCAVEWEQYPASVLVQRQNDKLLPAFPVWDDVRTFDGKPWRGLVDVVSGGFPCQDVSSAGKGAGINGERSSMWFHMLRIIEEVRPLYCYIENSPHLRTKGLVSVLQGLAEAGYHAAWGVLSAKDCGANHERKRMWIVGKRVASYANLHSKSTSHIHDQAQGVPRIEELFEEAPHTDRSQREGGGIPSRRHPQYSDTRIGGWWKDTTHLDGMDDGVAYRMDRLKAIGNGQVPIVAATAFQQLRNKLHANPSS
jgi:DNA (cytosine-5)-methyltransferase 1